MPARIFPLLRLDSLLPGESLPSLLTRLAQLNSYTPLKIIDKICLDNLKKDRLDYPIETSTYQRLADLTLQDPAELYAATAHRFAIPCTPPGVTIPPLVLPSGNTVSCLEQSLATKQLRPASAAQFCPDCLKENPYHRLAWMSVAVSACLEHNRLLTNHCPKCLKALKIIDIVRTRCSYCRATLTEAPLTPIGHDTFGRFCQQLIRVLLELDPRPDPWPHQLPDHPVQVLYRLVDGLRISIMPVEPSWPHRHYIEGATRAPQLPRFAANRRMSPSGLLPVRHRLQSSG